MSTCAIHIPGHTTRYMVNGEWKVKEKKSFPNQEAAIVFARSMNLREGHIHKLVAYKCGTCGNFHVGRNGKELTEKERDRIKKAINKLKM